MASSQMNAVQERRSHYVFDSAVAKALNQALKAQSFGLPTPEVGYRILPDYGGHDSVEFLLDFKGKLSEDSLTADLFEPLESFIREWSLNHPFLEQYAPFFGVVND